MTALVVVNADRVYAFPSAAGTNDEDPGRVDEGLFADGARVRTICVCICGVLFVFLGPWLRWQWRLFELGEQWWMRRIQTCVLRSFRKEEELDEDMGSWVFCVLCHFGKWEGFNDISLEGQMSATDGCF